MATNISDLISMLRDYIVNSINRDYPTIDTSEGSPFADLFVEPMGIIMEPIARSINDLELKMDLGNAEFISEEDLDIIGKNNYFIERDPGSLARGDVTFKFKEVSDRQSLIIPPDIIVSTDDGDLRFKTMARHEFTPSEMYLLYNPATYLYEVTVPVEAMGVGLRYNVAPGKITVLSTPFNQKFVSVTNASEFTGGDDRESNTEYAQRMREFYRARLPGSTPGYRRFVMDNFHEVQDVYVAGKGDEYMLRDSKTFVNPFDPEESVTVSLGGKTDIHVKGCRHDTIQHRLVVPESGHASADLIAPLKEIVSVENLTQNVTYALGSNQAVYNIVTHSTVHEEHSPRERKTLQITEPTVNPGDEILLTYKVVETLITLNNYFNIEENRIVTTDVLFKEAQPQPINISLNVKMKPGTELSSSIEAYISGVIKSYFDNMNLGDSVDESVIIAKLRDDQNIRQYTDYIYLPLTSLYVPTDLSEDVQDNRRDLQPITADKISYLSLNKVKICAV